MTSNTFWLLCYRVWYEWRAQLALMSIGPIGHAWATFRRWYTQLPTNLLYKSPGLESDWKPIVELHLNHPLTLNQVVTMIWDEGCSITNSLLIHSSSKPGIGCPQPSCVNPPLTLNQVANDIMRRKMWYPWLSYLVSSMWAPVLSIHSTARRFYKSVHAGNARHDQSSITADDSIQMQALPCGMENKNAMMYWTYYYVSILSRRFYKSVHAGNAGHGQSSI